MKRNKSRQKPRSLTLSNLIHLKPHYINPFARVRNYPRTLVKMGASHSSSSQNSSSKPYSVRARPSIRTSFASSSTSHSRHGSSSTSSSPSTCYEVPPRTASSQTSSERATSPPIRIGYPYYEDIALEAELAKQKSKEKRWRRRKFKESFAGGSR